MRVRKILVIMAIISFIVMTGFIGGLDRGTISLSKGFIGAAICTVIFAAACIQASRE